MSAHTHSTEKHSPLILITLLTFTYMIVEIIGGLKSGSLSLIADAGHMGVDTLAMGLSLFSLWLSHKPPSLKKTYGFKRAEVLGAFLNGILLCAAAIGIFIEAWHRFSEPRNIQGGLMATISFGGLLVNLVSMVLIHDKSKHNLNLRSVWLHLLTDLMGSVATLIAAFCIIKFGWNKIDPFVSVLLGIFILIGAYRLLSDCVHVLLDGVPNDLDITTIRNTLESFPAIDEVHDLHVWSMNQNTHSLSAHIILKEGVDFKFALETITSLLKKEFKINHATLQLEPETFIHEEEICLPA